MFLYDFQYSHNEYENFDAFSLDDVDATFKIVEKNVLKFNQTVNFKDKGEGITITPFYAGHMLGGTIWKISKDGEEDIFYCIDINNKPERHLNECALEKIQSPSLLIFDCLNVGYNIERRKTRDEQFVGAILETLRDNGNVMITVDTAGRMLELSLLLEQTWRSDVGLAAYQIVLLNKVSSSTMEFTKSLIEWMNDKLNKTFQGQRNNPYSFKQIQLLQNMSDLEEVKRPFVVLATQPDMECGYSRELSFRFATDPKNKIILTKRPANGSLAETVLSSESSDIKVVRSSRINLEGAELEAFMEQRRLDAMEVKSEAESDSDDSEEENFFDESNEDGNFNHSHKKHVIKHDLMVNNKTGQAGKGVLFSKSLNKRSYPMYPFIERKLKWDDYGEIIHAEDYVMFDISKAAIEEEDIYQANNNGDRIEDLSKFDTTDMIPTKCIKRVEDVHVECKVMMLDFEGRSDDRSLKQFIDSIKFKDIILIRGSEENQESFAEFCSQKSSGKVFMSDSSGTIDATSDRLVQQVTLRDSLLSSLNWVRAANGTEFTWVDAEVCLEIPEFVGEGDDGELHVIKRKGARDNLPALITSEESLLKTHSTVMLRNHDIKHFRNVLKDSGISTRAIRSGLLCNNNVIVNLKKSDEVIEIEGVISEEYFTIRNLLHQQFTVL